MNLLEKKDIQHKFRISAPLLVFMVFYMIWFSALEQNTGSHYHVIYSSLDSLIPFCEYFIVPYFLWFAFVPAIMIYLLFADEAAFRRTSLILMAGMLFFLITSTIYPTILYLRPTELPNDNIFCHVAPSIHVFNTLVVLEALHTCRGKLARNPLVLIAANVLSLLIILATMFLKQHSVLDVLSACIMFIAIVWCVDQFDFYEVRKPARVRDDITA